MNFRPTFHKIIGLIIALIIDFLFMFYISQFRCLGSIGENISCGMDFDTALYLMVKHPFSWAFIIGVYIIWSLIQKKK